MRSDARTSSLVAALSLVGGILFSVPGMGAQPPPALFFSTYLGGGGSDGGASIAVDAAGNSWIAGSTESAGFPGAAGAPADHHDVFVSRFNPAGHLIWSIRIGGSEEEYPTDIALDAGGNLYVSGSTRSADFPVRAALQAVFGGSTDAFLAKLSPNGQLLFSTYLGGSGDDHPAGIARDAAGRLYVSGTTRSADFPVLAALQPGFGGSVDAFLAKLSPGGQLLFSTYVGGSGRESSMGVVLDGSGHPYLAGVTHSEDFPFPSTLPPVPWALPRRPDTFVLKLSAAGSGPLYSVLLEGENTDEVHGIAVDAAGHAHVAGFTDSHDFPLVNDTHTGGPGDHGFLTRIGLDGSSLVYSTFLDGSYHDVVHDVALDGSGNAYVTGFTNSNDFPASGSLSGDDESGDLFLTKVGPDGVFLFSTYYGGFVDDRGLNVTVDDAGRAAVVGYTASSDYPLKNPFWSCGDCESRYFLTIFDTAAGEVLLSTLLDRVGDVAVGGGAFFVTGATTSAGLPAVKAFQPEPGGASDAFVLKWGGNLRRVVRR